MLNLLPIELLRKIFRCLNGLDVLNCSMVCVSWRIAVESLSNNDWINIFNNDCQKDEYFALRKKYGLTWYGTCKAMNSWSWSEIQSAELNIDKVGRNIQAFKILPEGILSCVLNSDLISSSAKFGDTVVYYNLETLQECGRLTFGFLFYHQHYNENMHLIVLVGMDFTLNIVVKKTGNHFYVGKLSCDALLNWKSEYTLIDKEVYFKNDEDKKLYVCREVETENSGPTICTKELWSEIDNAFIGYITEFSYSNDQLFIFTSKNCIYLYSTDGCKLVKKVDIKAWNSFLQLKEYGISWKEQAISTRLPRSFYLDNCFLNQLMYCHYSNVLLTSLKYEGKINIFYEPFCIGGITELTEVINSPPLKVINMKLMLNTKCIDQLDIIETSTTHKILALAEGSLFLFELSDSPQHMKLRSKRKLSAKTIKNKIKKAAHKFK